MRKTQSDWPLVLIIMGLGFLLRVFQLGLESISFDEFCSITIAQKSFSQMISIFSTFETHPPLYHFFLRLWLMLGKSEFILRFPSVVFGVLVILLTYLLGRSLFERKAALMAAFITSISSFHIVYSQEIRMYTLVTLLTIMSFYFLWKALSENKNVYWLGYLLSTVLAMYTHYYAILIVVAQVIFFIASWPRFKASLRKWLLFEGGVLLLYLPWMLVLAKIFTHVQEGFWIPQTVLLEIPNTLKWFSIGPLSFYDWPLKTAIILVALVVFSLLFIKGISSMFAQGKTEGKNNRLVLLFLLIWLLVPPALALILSLRQSIYQSRYLILVSPAFYLLVAKGILSFNSRKLQALFITLIIVLSSFSIYEFYFNKDYARRAETRPAAAFVQRNYQAQDAIAHTELSTYLPFIFYHPSSLQVREYIVAERSRPEYLGWTLTNQDYIKDSVHSITPKPKRLWLIVPTSWVSWRKALDPNVVAEKWLGKEYFKLKQKEYHGLIVYLYACP